jgi:uncharacterized membrane protein
MGILQFNLFWMLLNAWLAILPVLFINLALIFQQKPFKSLFFILWFLFIPNTIYVVCDMTHLIDQWSLLHGEQRFILLLQYIALESCGIAAFLLGLAPFHKLLLQSKWKKESTNILIGLNFLIGFALVLGKIERVNSWEVITNIPHLVNSLLHTLTYLPLLSLSFLLGVFANLVYFTAKQLGKK